VSDLVVPVAAAVPTLDAPLTPPAPAEAMKKPTGGTVLRGLVWIGGGRWAAQLFVWASTLIIARLLRPEDYGLVAMATVLTGFLEVVSDFGLGSALVQSRETTPHEVESAMGATVILAIVSGTVLFLSAPLWAHVQGDPRIVPIIRVLAFGVFLTVIGNVPYSMLHRRLAFGLVARAQFVKGLATAIATVGSAFLFQSHWALVIGYIAGRLAITVILFWAEPTRPRWPGREAHVTRLLKFGGVLTADRILNYGRQNLDIALVGALLGSRMVGLYVMATALARLPLEKLGSAFEPVAYPTFARLRDDEPQLRRFFLGLSLGTMAIALPATVGLMLTASLVVPTVIGNQWLPVVPVLRVAAFIVPFEFHLGIVSAMFNAMGRVDLTLRNTMLTSLLTIAGVLVGVHYGIVAVAAAGGTAYAAVWFFAEQRMLRMTGLTWRDLGGALLPALSATAGMALLVLAALWAMPASWPMALRLGVACTTGLVTFVAWALAFHRDTVVPQVKGLRTAWRTR
jgi:O-antigen/teichoic acid export membrane protein